LLNPATATVCDCGWSFADGMMTARDDADREQDLRNERSARATRELGIGALLLVVGIVITAATYGSASESGGTYIIAYGPIVVGVIKIIRGLAMRG
jgi:hypothetical protein